MSSFVKSENNSFTPKSYTKTKKTKYFVFAIIAALACLFCIYTLIFYPFSEILSPKEISSPLEISEIKEECYIKINVDKLYYSGFDNGSNGNYYYYFSNENCTFFLLEATDKKTASAELKDVEIYAKVIPDKDLITNLTASLAKQVGFTSDGLSMITSKCLVHQTKYTKNTVLLLFVMLLFFAASSLFICILNLVRYFKHKL